MSDLVVVAVFSAGGPRWTASDIQEHTTSYTASATPNWIRQKPSHLLVPRHSASCAYVSQGPVPQHTDDYDRNDPKGREGSLFLCGPFHQLERQMQFRDAHVVAVGAGALVVRIGRGRNGRQDNARRPGRVATCRDNNPARAEEIDTATPASPIGRRCLFPRNAKRLYTRC